MKALIYKDTNILAVEEVPMPEIEPGTVLVRSELSGICGSDVSMVKHGMAEPGSILGHELIASISELGPGVEGWQKGDMTDDMEIYKTDYKK